MTLISASDLPVWTPLDKKALTRSALIKELESKGFVCRVIATLECPVALVFTPFEIRCKLPRLPYQDHGQALIDIYDVLGQILVSWERVGRA